MTVSVGSRRMDDDAGQRHGLVRLGSANDAHQQARWRHRRGATSRRRRRRGRSAARSAPRNSVISGARPAIGPPNAPGEDLRQQRHLLVRRVAVEQQPGLPVAVDHHLRRRGWRARPFGRRRRPLDLTTLDPEREHGAAVVVGRWHATGSTTCTGRSRRTNSSRRSGLRAPMPCHAPSDSTGLRAQHGPFRRPSKGFGIGPPADYAL